jgi:hypothetical protein
MTRTNSALDPSTAEHREKERRAQSVHVPRLNARGSIEMKCEDCWVILHLPASGAGKVGSHPNDHARPAGDGARTVCSSVLDPILQPVGPWWKHATAIERLVAVNPFCQEDGRHVRDFLQGNPTNRD